MPSAIQGTATAATIAGLIKQAMGSQGLHGPRGASRTSGAGKGKAPAGRGSGASRDASVGAQPELAHFIASRVRELDPDAPDHHHRLMRVVVEATLLHEFGSSLQTAPKFQAMVDQVLHDMERSTLLQADMKAVLDELTASR